MLALLLILSSCAQANAASNVEVPPGESPLDFFFEEQGGQDEAFRQWQIDTQTAVAECMRLEGFEYQVAVAEATEIQRDVESLSRLDFASEHGYGISTSANLAAPDQLLDANATYLVSLDQQGRQRYAEALVGPVLANTEVTTTAGAGIPPLSEQGCSGQAVIDNGGQSFTEGLASFQAAQQQSLIEAKASVADAVQEWSSCMATQGFEYLDPDQPRAEIASELDSLRAPLVAQIDAMPVEQVLELLSSPNSSLPGLDETALRDLQEQERLLATTDAECFIEHVAQAFDAVVFDQELELLEEFGDQLQTARDALPS